MIRYSEAAAPISLGRFRADTFLFGQNDFYSYGVSHSLWKTLKLVLIILDHFIRMTSRMNTMIYTTTLRRRVSAVLMRLMDPHYAAQIYDGQKTGSVAVTGNTDVGSTLSIDWSSFGDTDGIDTNSVAYQWYRDGNIITGQTGSSYQILNSDVGRSISSSLSYLDNWGEQQFVSSNSINLTNSAPEISGLADISVAENLVDASDNVSASFMVSDDLLAAHELSYSFTSSNQALLPDASISTLMETLFMLIWIRLMMRMVIQRSLFLSTMT